MLRSSFNCSSVRSASISDTMTSSSRSTQAIISATLVEEILQSLADSAKSYDSSFFVASRVIVNIACDREDCWFIAVDATALPEDPLIKQSVVSLAENTIFSKSILKSNLTTCIEFHQTIDYSVQLLMVSFYLGLFYRGFRYDYDYEGDVAVAYRGDVAGYDYVDGDYFAVFVAVDDLPFSRCKRRLATRWAAPPTVGRLGPNGPRRPAKFEDELMRCKDLRPLDTSRLAGNLFLIQFFRAIEKINMCIKCVNGINAAIFYRLDPDIDNIILISDTTHLAIENNLKEA
uniref:Uncharacterized protein n=1 Tax=Glossina pallidipes TaxID=7398 RepID=A0A1A9ZHH0_GLOPL